MIWSRKESQLQLRVYGQMHWTRGPKRSVLLVLHRFPTTISSIATDETNLDTWTISATHEK